MSSTLAIRTTFYLDASSRLPESSSAWRDDYSTSRRISTGLVGFSLVGAVGAGIYQGFGTLFFGLLGAAALFLAVTGLLLLLGGRAKLGIIRPFFSLDDSGIMLRTRWRGAESVSWTDAVRLEIDHTTVSIERASGPALAIPLGGMPRNQAQEVKVLLRQIARERGLGLAVRPAHRRELATA